MDTALRQEVENLRYMWERRSSIDLACYREGRFLHPQHVLTRQLVCNYIERANPGINFLLEENSVRRCIGFYVVLLRRLLKSSITGSFLDPSRIAFGEFSRILGLVKYFRLVDRPLKRPSFLDVGCGSGSFYADFAISGLRRYTHYTGVDIAPKNIENARMFYPGIDFRVGNLLSLDLRTSSFDVVMISQVLEHISPEFLKPALDEILRVSKGLVIIHFFREMDIPHHVVKKIGRYHWNCLSRRKLMELLDRDRLSVKILDRYSNSMIRFIDTEGEAAQHSTWVIEKRGLFSR